MATIEQTIAQIEAELDAQVKREQRSRAEIKLIIERGETEGRSAMTEPEKADVKSLFERIEDAKAQQRSLKEKLALAQRVKAEEAESDADVAAAVPTAAAARADSHYRTAHVSVGREERTYNPDKDPTGKLFLSDVARQFAFGDPDASARLSRHMHEERVERAGQLQARATSGVGTSAFAGLTVPQYLVDMVAPATANLRPFADACNPHPLPADGMSVNISRITTASTTGLQAAELDDVDALSTDMDDTLLTIAVQTAAGDQIVSRQAIERGNGIEDTILQDLFARFRTTLDSTLINQATTGLDAVGQAVTYTSASPTGEEFYPFTQAGASKVESALLAQGYPTHIVMHSRRYHWLSGQMTAKWPMITAGGTAPVAGSNGAVQYAGGIRGYLPSGLAVVVDNNVPTNKGTGTDEDRAYVVSARECHLWEDRNAPALIRAEQPKAGNLGVLLVVYGYFAYTFSRYANAVASIQGTGMVGPTGF